MHKKCTICGRVMKTSNDYAMGDISKTYCQHCQEQKGFLKAYQRKVKSMALFIVKTQATVQNSARHAVSHIMAKVPTHRHYKPRGLKHI